MTKTPEGKVKDRIMDIIKSHGDYISVLKYVPTGFGGVGTEDFTLCAYGVFVAVEAKATNKSQVRDTQKVRKKNVLRSGGIYVIIHKDNLRTLEHVLSRIRQARKATVDQNRKLLGVDDE